MRLSSQARAARDRVLKNRAAHSHLSTRTEVTVLCSHESVHTSLFTRIWLATGVSFACESLGPEPALRPKLGNKRKIAVPGIGDDQPGSQAPPNFQVLPAIGNGCAIALMTGHRVASHFHRHVAGALHAKCLQAQIFVSGIG